jgi:FtsH-binding integral membrane protein
MEEVTAMGEVAVMQENAARTVVSRDIGLAMVAEAATFLVASAIHFGIGFDDAAIPELVIAVVMGLASMAVLTRRAGNRTVAIAATAFATFGTIVGLTIIATGRQDAPDLAYHSAILVALVVTLTVMLRRPATGHR